MKAIVRARPSLTRALAWAAIAVGVGRPRLLARRPAPLGRRDLHADGRPEERSRRFSRPCASIRALRSTTSARTSSSRRSRRPGPAGRSRPRPLARRVPAPPAAPLRRGAAARAAGDRPAGRGALFASSRSRSAYAAEGRAYALASLLVLLAFERALALRERPRLGVAVGLSLAAAGAVLTHYLAVFPVAALAILACDARPRRASALVLSGLAAAALAGDVGSRRPRPAARLDGVVARRRPSRALSGTFPRISPSALPQAAAGHGGARRGGRGPPRGPARPRARGGAPSRRRRASSGSRSPFSPRGQLAAGALVLPERTALVFLPFVALLLAEAPPAIPAARRHGLDRSPRALASARRRAVAGRAPRAASRDARARRAPRPRRGLLGSRARLPARARGRSRPRHPLSVRGRRAPGLVPRGGDLRTRRSRPRRRRLSRPRRAPTLFVLPRGSRASAALASRLGPARRLLASPLVDVVEIAGP